MRRRGLLLALCLIASARQGQAQSRSRAYLDLTIAGTELVGGEPVDGDFFYAAGVFLLTIGTQPDVNRSFIAAFHAGAILNSHDDVCHWTPLGRCYEDHPFGNVLAITFGARPLTAGLRTLELTMGPALIGQGDYGSQVGALALARWGTPPGHAISFGLVVNAIATRLDGQAVLSAGWGVSVRTW